ncbi:ATP-binding protein [Thermocatellispora tengchongensis]|uniref:hypothetical protein n=1 Tax=Thermocatellispora tengchongensis TaxID=1073253 RepID=UPI00363327A0
MTARELSALAALRFNTVQNPDDVWRPSQFHVDGMHRATLRTLREGFAEAREGDNPLGVVVQGRRGSGKTHLLGWVREEIQGDHGYFFLVTLLDAKSFWQSVVVALLDGLSRESVDGWSQLKLFLQRLCQQAGVSRTVRRAVIGDGALTREHLDSFVGALRRLDQGARRPGPGHRAGPGAAGRRGPGRPGRGRAVPVLRAGGGAGRARALGDQAGGPDAAGDRAGRLAPARAHRPHGHRDRPDRRARRPVGAGH